MTRACFMLACCLAVVCPAFAVTNLLPEGGFEAGAWKLTKWDHGEATHEFTAAARTGAKAVKLAGISGEKAAINVLCHSPAVDVKEGQEYVLSLWYRTSGGTGGFVSILTYKQPWATAQWKTPTTTYANRALPPAAQWTPWTWRFRAAPGSVQLVAMVRCHGVGTVWYDDVALFPATAAQVKVTEPGTITALPDQRRLKAEVAVSQEAARWKAFLLAVESGKQLATREGSQGQATVELSYQAGDGTPLALVLEDAATKAVLATAELTAPRLIEFQMLSPRYRDSIYLSVQPKSVRARLTCTADAALRKGTAYAVRLDNGPPTEWKPIETVNDLAIPLPATLTGKSLTLAVDLKGIPGRERLSSTLKVVPRTTAGREVIFGDHNETLVDGKPLFPAGFYGMPIGAQADPIAQAGYNAALTYNASVDFCQKWLDDCKRLGLLGMVSVPYPFVGTFDESKLREAIRTVKQHPALLGYYLFDEPSRGKPGQTPAELKRVFDVVADEDPYHPIGVCINQPDVTDDYADCYDVVMPDPYPLLKTRLPMTYVSDRMDVSREALRDRKPVWVVPQAFGWDVIQGIDDPERYRTPTPEQERCMTYLALAHGARGVMYYCYHVYTRYDAEKKKSGGWPYVLGGYLPDQQPKLWAALAQLGEEMKRLGPALAQPESAAGVAGMVHWRLLPSAEGDWLLAVNADDTKPASATISLTGKRADSVTVVFGPGAASGAEGGVKVDLPPIGTVAAVVRTK